MNRRTHENAEEILKRLVERFSPMIVPQDADVMPIDLSVGGGNRLPGRWGYKDGFFRRLDAP